ncbi:peptidoglycan recognition protein family protein [Cellulomonas soli]
MLEILSPNKYAGRVRPIRLIVVHTMEVAESPAVAEAVARAFANPARKASAHVCADTDSRVRCVPDADTAWAAPGANADGLQLELAGYARQDLAGWSDPASVAILEQGAQQAAEWVRAHGIPIRHLSVAQILAGEAGFVGHADVNAAYHRSTHWDPGASFPWDTFLARVATLAGTAPAPGTAPTPPTTAPAVTNGGIDVSALPTLKKGSKGVAVKRAQGLLIANGYGIGKAGIDGDWGNSTDAGFRAFQIDHPTTGTNGQPDGSCGTRSWSALLGL